MVRCGREKATVRPGGVSTTPPSQGGPGCSVGGLPSAWPQLRQGSLRLVTGCCRSMRGAVGGLGFFQPLHLQASLAWDKGQEKPSHSSPCDALYQGCHLLWPNNSPHKVSSICPTHPYLLTPAFLRTHPA